MMKMAHTPSMSAAAPEAGTTAASTVPGRGSTHIVRLSVLTSSDGHAVHVWLMLASEVPNVPSAHVRQLVLLAAPLAFGMWVPAGHGTGTSVMASGQ